ncbi:MAG: hypothetical protein LBK99_13330 [Opitutaceae bacterium]|jgi:hypothetical protein|nr:hypothetical protein [Opitutaceae bacterium]
MKLHNNHVIGLTTIAIAMLASAPDASAQNLSTNGDFEGWNALTGTPPRGNPHYWSGTVTRTAGLAAGSTYSATIQPESIADNLFQTPTFAATDFTLSFQFVTTDSGSTSNRSMQLILGNSSTSAINLILTRGTTAGVLSLKAHNGSTWVTLLPDAFTASTYDSATGTWSNTTVYQMTITASFGANKEASSWTISYGLAGEGQSVPVNGSIFASTPPATGLGQLRFTTSAGAGGSAFAIDNISLTQTQAVPEPRTVALFITTGVLLLAGVIHHRNARHNGSAAR